MPTQNHVFSTINKGIIAVSSIHKAYTRHTQGIHNAYTKPTRFGMKFTLAALCNNPRIALP